MFRSFSLSAAALPLASLAACVAATAPEGEAVGSSSSALTPCLVDSPSCPTPRPPVHGGGGKPPIVGEPAPPPGPQLDSVVYGGWGSPGYTITGIDFGATPGSVYLEGNFAGGSLFLTVTSWSDTQITAVVPAGTSGYVAQQGVSIGVVNALGPSNTLSTSFTPELSSVYLGAAQALGIFCSSNASIQNSCPDPNYSTSLGGLHVDEAAPITQFGPTRQTSGSDFFYLPTLKNGWAYVNIYLGGYGVAPLGGWNGTVSSGMQVLEVDWSTEQSYAEDLQAPRAPQHPANQIEYTIDVQIEGPLGVPYL